VNPEPMHRSAVQRRVRRLRSLGPTGRLVVLQSIVLLPVMRLALRARGFKPVMSRSAAWSDGLARPLDPERVAAVAQAVGLVAKQPIVGASCLPQSLVTWFLLRRRGADAVLVLGAQGDAGSVSAHAWVELDGAVVNDTADVRARFGSFDLQHPRLAWPAAAATNDHRTGP